MSKNKTLRSYFCWLLGHSYIRLYRYNVDYAHPDYPEVNRSEQTGWICQHCEDQVSHQYGA